MILRAIFWIAVVAVLMPREPDLGLGRPDASAPSLLLSRFESLFAPGAKTCGSDPVACVAANSARADIPDITTRGLAEVKAEFDEARRERAARHNG
ncbi:MAG: hypothetical protein ACTHLR_04260 [Rhizomicrobium sp.]